MAKDHDPGRRGAPRPRSWESPLRKLLDSPVDAGYADAAARRRASGAPPSRVLRAVTWLTVLAVGVGLVVAGRELSPPSGGRDPVRAELAGQIEGAQRAAAALSAGNEDLAAEVDALRESVLSGAPEELGDAARTALTGASQYSLTGPALVVVLTDSPASVAGLPGSDDGRVRDTDIQTVVNGLWSLGAEGIAVDDRRLSSTTAVRAAGRAILVNLEATSSPYRIVALGDPDVLRDGLTGTTAGEHLERLADQYDIGVGYEMLAATTLPALDTRSTTWAEPLQGPGGPEGED